LDNSTFEIITAKQIGINLGRIGRLLVLVRIGRLLVLVHIGSLALLVHIGSLALGLHIGSFALGLRRLLSLALRRCSFELPLLHSRSSPVALRPWSKRE